MPGQRQFVVVIVGAELLSLGWGSVQRRAIHAPAQITISAVTEHDQQLGGLCASFTEAPGSLPPSLLRHSEDDVKDVAAVSRRGPCEVALRARLVVAEPAS